MSEALRLADALERRGYSSLTMRLLVENEALKTELRQLHALNGELVEALRVAVKLNGFREFNDHIPAMKAALAKAGVGNGS